MSNKFHILLGVVVLVATLVFSSVMYAADPKQDHSGDISEDEYTCENAPGMSFKMVRCVEIIIESATKDHMDDVGKMLKNLIAGLIILYIMFFGVKLMFGAVEKLRAELIIVILHILIVFIVVVIGGVSTYIKVLKDSQTAISSIMSDSIEINSSICTQYQSVWLKFDCVITSILGTEMPGDLDADPYWTSTPSSSPSAPGSTGTTSGINTAGPPCAKGTPVTHTNPFGNRGYRITSNVNPHRKHPTIPGLIRPHKGVDMVPATRGGIGTPIYATADGDVIVASRQTGYGNVVKIKHDDCLVTVYAHLNKIIVSRGDRVKQGTQIGTMGKSGGISTGPHLHYEHRDGPNKDSGYHVPVVDGKPLSKNAGNVAPTGGAAVNGTSSSGQTTTISPVFVEERIMLFRIVGGLLVTEYGIVYLILAVLIVIIFALAIVQAMFIYMSSLLIITLLGILAPIFIPMILFQQTKGYFDAWLKMLLGHFLQPILILGYLAFMVSILGYLITRDCPSGSVASNCGLVNIYKEIRANKNKYRESRVWFSLKTLVSPAKSKATEKAKKAAEECDDLHKTKNRNCSAARSLQFLWSADELEDITKALSFIQELIMIVILLLLTFGLMGDVLSNAGRLAGSMVNGIGAKINVYNNAYSAVVRSLRGKGK